TKNSIYTKNINPAFLPQLKQWASGGCSREMMRRNNWILFFLLLGASFLWGVIYWMFIAK
ncbi:hypothetical protein DXK91_13615, partial [Parageobacillus toebii]